MTNFVQLGSQNNIPEWITDTATKVQEVFGDNGHEFILIPCVNPKNIDDKELRSGKYLVGTVMTDVDDVTEFCICMAGAISAYSKSAKKGTQNKAMVLMGEQILDILKDVAKLDEKRGRNE